MNFFVVFAAIVGVLVTIVTSQSEPNLCMINCPEGMPQVCAYIGHGQYMTFDGVCEAMNDACSKGVPAYNPIVNHACDQGNLGMMH